MGVGGEGGLTLANGKAVGARESKQTGQRHSKDIISKHELASCVTHECHLLQFKALQWNRGATERGSRGGREGGMVRE